MVTEHKFGSTFRWLNATQFLGALNDNVFRWLILFFLISKLGNDKTDQISQWIGIIFVAPFLLFIPFAGIIADKFSKRNIIVVTKFAELAIMSLGCLFLAVGHPYLVYGILFLMCTQSAFFSPCKYGIVPELVDKGLLSKVNSYLEGLTYFAVVIGTVIASIISQASGGNYAFAGLICIVLAVIGIATSFRITKTVPIAEQSTGSIFFLKIVWDTLVKIRHDKDLILAVFASAFFMLLGGFLQMNLIPYGMEHLSFTDQQSGYLFVIAAIGIGFGSWVAGRVSGRHIEFGIVPAGALGLALSTIILSLIPDGYKYPVFACIFVTGTSAGLFIVPVHAFIQLRAPDKIRGQVVAASNFIGWIGVLLAAIFLFVLKSEGSFGFGLSSARAFLVLGLLTLGLAIITLYFLPDFFVRFIIVAVARMCYRVDVVNEDAVPTEGSALLVSNHISWADAVLIGVTQQRRIRFIMDRDIYRKSIFRPVLKMMGVILVSQSDPPKKILASLRQARQAMDDGYLVCIFAEGAISRTGHLQRFKGGFERIVKNSDYPIIPVYIGGAWGSIFSYYDGKLVKRMPRKFPYPVTIHFGQPMANTSTADQIHDEVQLLCTDYYDNVPEAGKTLAEVFIRTARKHWKSHCISDVTGKRLSYGEVLTGSVALAGLIEPVAGSREHIGIILPPSNAGVLANIAVALLGRTSVNISYVASAEARKSAIDQCEIKTIISSREFLEKAGIKEPLQGVLYMEDLREQMGDRVKRNAFIRARFYPAGSLMYRKVSTDEVATVIFSSGSTGEPKGIMLTHHNILSNIYCMRSVFRIYRTDKLCGILPFFHSFGLTITLWLPLTVGVSTAFVPNPIDGKAVAESVRENGSTLLMATPTFLMCYIRRVKKEDFATLRKVIVGAEKLKKKVADIFESRLGIRPDEGYGTTELSPLVSINLDDVEVDGIRHIASKEGTIGKPVPGISVKIVDPDTFKKLEIGQKGLLLVKGPNVMKGYLKDPEKTGKVLKDGWYNTGDIACLDEDGFISITDRLSRFSKIGGEMVPHINLEEICQAASDSTEVAVAVTSVPDPKKGEELVVLYVPRYADPDRLHKAVSESNLPNISKPRRDNYLPVDAIPILGSGKLDIMKLKRIAIEAKNAME